MKRILAFVLVLCGMGVLLASPAAEALTKGNFDDVMWEAMKVSGVLLDTDGNNVFAADTDDDGLVALDPDNVYQVDFSTWAAAAPDITAIKSVKGVDNFSNLTKLDLTGCTGITSVKLDGLEDLATVVLPDPTGDADNVLTAVEITNCGSDAGVTLTLPTYVALVNSAPAITTLNLSGTILNENNNIVAAGIPTLTELTTLNLSGVTAGTTSALANLPVSTLTKLVTLDVSKSALAGIDTAGVVLATLETLDLSGASKLLAFGDVTATVAAATTVDMQYARNVKTLNLSGTKVVTLELSNAELKLESLNASGCKDLTTINTKSVRDSGNALVYYTGALKTVDLSGCKALKVVSYNDADGGDVYAINGVVETTGMPALETFNLACTADDPNKAIVHVAFGNSTAGIGRFCTSLVSADLSYCTKLGTSTNAVILAVMGGVTSGVDAWRCSALTMLVLKGCPMGDTANGNSLYGSVQIGRTSIAAIDLSDCTLLGYLYASGTADTVHPLAALDLSKNLQLRHIVVNDTSLASLDVSDHTSLISVYASTNKNLTTVNTGGCSALRVLVAPFNDVLASLDVTGSERSLRALNLRNGAIEELDLSQHRVLNVATTNAISATAIQFVDLRNNKLAKVDVARSGVIVNKYVAATIFVSDQYRAMPDSTVSGPTFNFTSVGLTAADMEKVQDVKGNYEDYVEDAQMSGTVATFTGMPKSISYNYETGAHQEGTSDPFLMNVTLSWNTSSDVPSQDVAPVLSASASTVTATEGTAITTVTITATAGENLTWTTSGTLPTGVTGAAASDGKSYTIAGTPEAGTAAEYTYTVTATNAAGSDNATVAITVSAIEKPAILTTSLPAATVGTAYSQRINVEGDVDTWSINYADADDATLEDLGLSFSNGVISGTPTERGTTGAFTVTATNSAGSGTSDSLTLTVNSGSNTTHSSSSGGCDAGFGALALAVLGLFGLKRK